MFEHIMVPVDLANPVPLAKALSVAANLAKQYGAQVTAVAVTTSAPSSVAHNPREFGEVLEKFAANQSEIRGVKFGTKVVVSSDPTIDIDDALTEAATELKCDLAVMASHVPGLAEHIFASRAGYFASHATFSVFVVR